MPTKQELKDGPLIIKKVPVEDLDKTVMTPLDYCSLSGLVESDFLTIKILKDLADISQENTSLNFSEDIYELVNLSDIDKTLGEISNYSLLESFNIQSQKSKFYQGDIIFSKLRPYLNNVAYVHSAPIKNNFFIGSSELMRIKAYEYPYYLFLALRSEFTLYQTSASNGSIRPRFTMEKLQDIEIPYLKDLNLVKEIDNIIEEIFHIRSESKTIIDELISWYDDLFKESTDDGFYIKKVNVSNLNAKRMDANFYTLKDFHKNIKNYDYVKLIDLLEFSNDKISDFYSSDEIINYITTSEVNKNQGEIVNWEEKVYKPTGAVFNKAPGRAQMLLSPNQILVPHLKLSIGTVAWVPDDLDKFISTNGFMVINAKNNDYGFLYLLFRSKLVSMQLRLIAAGTIMEDIRKEDISNVLIINISDEEKEFISKKMLSLLNIRWQSRKIYRELLFLFEDFCKNNNDEFKNNLDLLKNQIINLKFQLNDLKSLKKH